MGELVTHVGRLNADTIAVRVIVEVLACRPDHRLADFQADVGIGRAEVGDEWKQRLSAEAAHIDDGGVRLHKAPNHLEGHHPHRVVLGDAPLEHVVKCRSHFLNELLGTTGHHFITVTHARVMSVS